MVFQIASRADAWECDKEHVTCTVPGIAAKPFKQVLPQSCQYRYLVLQLSEMDTALKVQTVGVSSFVPIMEIFRYHASEVSGMINNHIECGLL